MKKCLFVNYVVVIFVCLLSNLFGELRANDDNNIAEKKVINVPEYMRSIFKNGWQSVIVRFGDEFYVLCDSEKNKIVTKDFFKIINDTSRYSIKLTDIDIDDKDGKKYVTLERQDNARKTKIPLDKISKPDQKYVYFTRL